MQSQIEDDFTPRDYQMKLMEIAVKQNTIIYLPTGSGKTFIAVMVLKQLSEPLKKPISQGGKISVMLVNTVALVDQHSKYLQRFTHFEVGAYTGDMNVDLWNEQQWKQEFNNHQVLVMTSQILINLIVSSALSLNDINLIIFDECHRGVSDHPMRQIMINFKGLVEPPRVLGLTATLLNQNCSPGLVMNEVEALETTFHSKVATIDELTNVIGHDSLIFCVVTHNVFKCTANINNSRDDVLGALSTIQQFADKSEVDVEFLNILGKITRTCLKLTGPKLKR